MITEIENHFINSKEQAEGALITLGLFIYGLSDIIFYKTEDYEIVLEYVKPIGYDKVNHNKTKHDTIRYNLDGTIL